MFASSPFMRAVAAEARRRQAPLDVVVAALNSLKRFMVFAAAEPRAPLPGSRSICICAVGVFRSVE